MGATLGLDGEVGELLLLTVFLVLVEGDHLVQELAGHLIEWGHLVRRDRNLDVLYVSYNGLEFGVVDSVQGLHYLEVVGDHFFFMNCLLDRRKVFLVREIYMIEKWAFTW